MSYQFKAFAGLPEGASPPAPRVIIPGPKEHYVLPEGMTKTGAIHFACQALTISGVTRSAVQAFRLIADTTDAAAWSSRTSAPINWRQAQTMAAEIGVSPRQWRRLESELEHAGAIARVTAENGFRGQKCRGAIAFGLSLEPAVANLPVFMAIIEQAQSAKQAEELVVSQIRAIRHRLRKRLEFFPNAAASAALAEIEAQRLAAPSIHRDQPPCPALAAYFESLAAIEDGLIAQNRAYATSQSGQDSPQARTQTATEATQKSQKGPKNATSLKSINNIGKMSGGRPKMSAAPDMNVPCHYNLDIQKQTLNADFEFEEKAGLELSGQDADGLTREASTTMAKAEYGAGDECLEPRQACVEAVPAVQVSACETGGDGAGAKAAPAAQQQRQSGHIETSGLTAATLLDLRAIERVYSHNALLEDIRAVRSGTACAGLDPQHIWDRFRRYNLKRDKQLIPLAALRAFMRGWIPDGQGAYVPKDQPQPQNGAEIPTKQGLGATVSTAHTNSAALQRQGQGALQPASPNQHPDIQAWWAKASWDNRHFDERDLRRKLGGAAYDAQVAEIKTKYSVGQMVAQMALHGREMG